MRKIQMIPEQNYLAYIFNEKYEAPEEQAIRDSQVLPDKILMDKEKKKGKK